MRVDGRGQARRLAFEDGGSDGRDIGIGRLGLFVTETGCSGSEGMVEVEPGPEEQEDFVCFAI